MKHVYLDYAATTPIDQVVIDEMHAHLGNTFGNPSSLHVYGKAAREVIDVAREQVAAAIHADPSEIIWTSGATEADNLAIKGIAKLYQRRGKHIITMQTEHKAVLDACQYLEKNGWQVTYLKPLATGEMDLAALKNAIRPDTVLVSIMHINNETGVVQNLAAIFAITQQHGIFLHVDAAQSIGKVALNLKETPVDLLSLSAHKVYGPKGIGALYLRRKPRVRVEPLLHGGGHEQGMRSGTLATHQIVGMGKAFELATKNLKNETQQIIHLRKLFLQSLQHIPNLKLNVNLETSVPHILSVRFENMFADAILAAVPDVLASTASACQGKGTEGSYVLRAMGLSQAQIKSSIRFSFGRQTTEGDIHYASERINQLFAAGIPG